MVTATTTATKTATATASKTATASSPSVPLRADGRGFPVRQAATPGMKQYTWEEVAQHNTEQSAWVYVGNRVYDITSWMDKHPGGKQMLMLAAGRDCTDLLPSYHPFTDAPTKVLARYQIGEMATTEFPQYKTDSGFYKEVCAEVGKYFKTTKRNYKDPLPGLLRLAFFIIAAFACYAVVVYHRGSLPFSVRFLAAVLFGVFQALPLLHCMHDASHTSIGNSQAYWDVIGRFTMDWFAGASLNSWFNQHVLGHHVYTNVMGVDPDLPIAKSGDIRRVCDKQVWAPMYRFQHLYLLVLYGVLGIKFRIQDITCTIIDKSNGLIRVNDLGAQEFWGQVASKTFWAFWRLYLPLAYFGVPFWSFCVLTIVSEFVTGYYLAFNFQVSHVSPSAEFPDYEGPQFEYEWAQSQLVSTIDYAHDSPLATLLCGALNYQSVHHLFPSVSQYHYPAIAPIVKRVAQKHKVRYNYEPSFWAAFMQHVQHLKTLGAEGAAHALHHY